jgi:hypothetical protein
VFLLFKEGLVIRMVTALRQSTGVANRSSDHPRLGDHEEAASRHAGDTTEPDRESRGGATWCNHRSMRSPSWDRRVQRCAQSSRTARALSVTVLLPSGPGYRSPVRADGADKRLSSTSPTRAWSRHHPDGNRPHPSRGDDTPGGCAQRAVRRAIRATCHRPALRILLPSPSLRGDQEAGFVITLPRVMTIR